MKISKIISEDWQGIRETLFAKKYFLGWVALTIVILFLYAVLTDIILLKPFGFNPTLDFLNVFLITLIALGASTVLAMTIFRFRQNWAANKNEKTGLIGSFLAAFATACPVCQPIWLIWLGLGSASAFLVEYSAPIALISLALIVTSLHFVSQSIHKKTCKTPFKKNSEKIKMH